jgi:hypothetical protein
VLIHDLGDDRQACQLSCFSHDFQTFFFQTLKAVGGGTGFKGPSPDYRCASFFYLYRRLEIRIFVLHGAGPGHQDNFGAADLHSPNLEGGFFLLQLPAGEFKRLRNKNNFFHSRHGLQDSLDFFPGGANRAQNSPVFTLGAVDTVAKTFNPPFNLLHILLARTAM